MPFRARHAQSRATATSVAPLARFPNTRAAGRRSLTQPLGLAALPLVGRGACAVLVAARRSAIRRGARALAAVEGALGRGGRAAGRRRVARGREGDAIIGGVHLRERRERFGREELLCREGRRVARLLPREHGGGGGHEAGLYEGLRR
eukprot:1741613-Prymnesium_polylepis.1